MKRVMIAVLALLLIAPAFQAQSLVDLAKQEKDRRAALKGKRGPVVTNADLGKTKTTAEKTRRAKPGGTRTATPPSPVSGQALPVVVRSPQSRSDSMEPRSGSRLFATGVLAEFEAELPQNALRKPDGVYAEVKYYGYLDLAIELVNGNGDDVAVYARGPDAGIMPRMMAYAVFAGSDGKGPDDWIFLGQGNGRDGPDSFDLGDLESTGSLRIMYRMFPAEREVSKPIREYPRDYAIRIDAVKSLHGPALRTSGRY